jgi:hydroxylysine kinase
VPRTVAGKDGELVQKICSAEGEHRVRLLTWLPGIPYETGPAPSLAALHQVGAFIARLNLALEGFSHPAATQFMPWNICNGLIFKQQLQGLLSMPTLELARPALSRLERDVFPQLPAIRSQVIHQDGHGGNLLRRARDSEDVSGVIDFGDMIYGPLISDLAVCASYFIEDNNLDATRIASAICAGFATLIPLEPVETEILLDLIIARHLLTLQLFEFQRRYVKNSPAFIIDEQAVIIASLRRLMTIDPLAFTNSLRGT